MPGTAQTTQPHYTSGPGWTAVVTVGEVELAVSPDGDSLTQAVKALLSRSQRRHWLLEWDHEDQHGWDVYMMHRALSGVSTATA
jgi:hypothetical protein